MAKTPKKSGGDSEPSHMARVGELVRATTHSHELLAGCQEDAITIFRAERARLGLSQEALAAKLGTHKTYVSKVENGWVRPGYDLFVKLWNLAHPKGKP